MQAGSRGIGEHVEHIKLGLRGVFNHLIGLLFAPDFLPFFLYFTEVIIHSSDCLMGLVAPSRLHLNIICSQR